MIASGQIEPAVYQQTTMIGKIQNSHKCRNKQKEKIKPRRGKVRLIIKVR